MPNNFEKLKVFKEAHEFVQLIYKYTEAFPKTETFGLTGQLRRASVSIAANIVEGNSRNHTKEYIQFLYQARGSLEEAKYHILLAKDLGYLKKEDYLELQAKAELVGKLLSGLVKYWKSLKS